MDTRGGCCIARYDAAYDSDVTKVDQIMLRYRPIAPKPAQSGVVSPPTCAAPPPMRVKKRPYNRRSKKKETATTLPLLPQTPVKRASKSSACISPTSSTSSERAVVTAPQAVRVAGSCVTVEHVRGTWAEYGPLGGTDEEMMWNLGRDTCPGLVTDAWQRVTWANGAYRRMVGWWREEAEAEEVVVRMVVRGALPMETTAFNCTVRVQYYTCRKERASVTVPCDVWRMDGGGFAWRLDVDAALSLGI